MLNLNVMIQLVDLLGIKKKTKMRILVVMEKNTKETVNIICIEYKEKFLNK